ncbi:MAG TPA: DUF1707 domain-containing protein, partial [Geodermatophilus sp.]|nr:DUF1707 domain-containing protein [Geodermatophilus sp.]
MPEPHLRAADADRAAVAAQLGEQMSAGRLTVAEYDERLTRAYASRTYGELDELTADLPAPAPSSAGAPDPSLATTGTSSSGASRSTPRPAWGHLWGPGMCGSWTAGPGRAVWGQWLTTALIVTTIWLVSSLGSGDWIYPWPIWVVGPWGAVLLAQTLGGRGRPAPHGRGERIDVGTTTGNTAVAA